MKTKFILFAVVLSSILIPAKAQQKLTVDLSHASNYIAHGRTLSNNLGCFQPGLYYGLKSGTTVMGWVSAAWDRTTSFNDEWNIIVDQNNNLFKDQDQWNINLHGYVNYWYLPNFEKIALYDPTYPTPSQSFLQGMKYNAGVHFPLVLSKSHKLKLTTGYDFYYYHEIGRNTGEIQDGGIHELLVKFNKSFKSFDTEYKTVISNNRGAVSTSIIPGWTYFSQHLSVLYTNKYISLRPSINYQRTLHNRLSTQKHLVWFSFGVLKTFKL